MRGRRFYGLTNPEPTQDEHPDPAGWDSLPDDPLVRECTECSDRKDCVLRYARTRRFARPLCNLALEEQVSHQPPSDTRKRVLEVFYTQAGPLPIVAIMAATGLPYSTIRNHVYALRKNGQIVAEGVTGLTKLYRLASPP